jgi:hypothetical protein
MFQIFPTMQEANRIIDTEQKSLFNLRDYQIAPVPVREPVGDWGWEDIGSNLLPNSKNSELGSKSPPSKSPVREQADSTLLPNQPVREQPDSTLLPNQPVREQPLKPNTQSPNLQIVTVKSQKYFLTPTKSRKELPKNIGWFDIKKQKGNLYLYLRWREGETQKSGCLGRLDKITSKLES